MEDEISKKSHMNLYSLLFSLNIFLINPILLLLYAPSIWISLFIYPFEQTLIFINLTIGIFLTPLWISNLAYLFDKFKKNWIIKPNTSEYQIKFIPVYLIIFLFGILIDFIIFGQNSILEVFVLKFTAGFIFLSLVFLTLRSRKLEKPHRLEYYLFTQDPNLELRDQNMSKLIYYSKSFYRENADIRIVENDNPWIDYTENDSGIIIKVNEGLFTLDPLEFEYIIIELLVKSKTIFKSRKEIMMIFISLIISISLYFFINIPSWETVVLFPDSLPLPLKFYLFIFFSYIFAMIIPYLLLSRYYWKRGLHFAIQVKKNMDLVDWNNYAKLIVERIGNIDRFSELSIYYPNKSQIIRKLLKLEN